jgi:hypothetical protein
MKARSAAGQGGLPVATIKMHPARPKTSEAGSHPGGSAPAKTRLVGGFPWSESVTSSGLPIVGQDSQPAAPLWSAGADDAANAALGKRNGPAGDPWSWERIKNRLEAFIAQSPAWTISLSLHILLLLMLAIWTIRLPDLPRLRLVLAFGPGSEPGQRLGSDDGERGDVLDPTPDSELHVEVAAPVEAVAEASQPMPAVSLPTVAEAAAASALTQPASGGARSAAPIGSGLSGRDPGVRWGVLVAGGGNDATEAAVAKALEWIVRQQRKDGLWSLKGPYAGGGPQENRLAGSALALLALQGAGNTPGQGVHREAVAKAWKALLKLQQDDGTFDAGDKIEQHQMYAHGQITIAVCELFGMTKDPQFEEPARRALAYAVAAQMPDGGWRYQPPRPNEANRGDMSVSGWFLMALKSGDMAGLNVPAESYRRLESFLDAVFISDEKGYGYQISPGQKFFDFRPALTAEALLCRQYLGWIRDDPRLVAGVELLVREAPIDFDYRRKNAYAWYYATQVCHHMGGPIWAAWNRRMQDSMLPEQVLSGREAGSWDPANDKWGQVGGRLYMTSLCACMLEVYYRHLPLYGSP